MDILRITGERTFGTDAGHMYLNRFFNLNSVVLLIIATPFLMVLSRNIASPILVAVTALLVFLACRELGWRGFVVFWNKRLTSTPVLVFVALLVFMMSTSWWSTAIKRCLESTGHLAGNLILFSLCVCALTIVSDRLKIRIWIPAVALLATSALVVSELHFGSPVRVLLGGSNEPFRMNRAAVAIVLFLPVVLLFLQPTKVGFGLGLAATLTVGTSAFYSESESAKFAFVIAVATLPVFMVAKQRSIWPLCLLVLASFLFMPLIAPHIMGVVPEFILKSVSYSTLGLRADIWAAHASLLSNTPIFGHGVEASFMAGEDYKHTDIPQRFLGWGHPHNFAIQVWYELGLVGVALFSTLIFMFFRSLRSVPDRFLPMILSTTATVWTVSLVSHGAWQAWWWCLAGLLSLLWLMVLKSHEAKVELATES